MSDAETMKKNIFAVKETFIALIKDTQETSLVLVKIVVPVLILTKILEEVGLIEQLSSLLAPLMNLLGLPGEFGLVWASAMATSLYAGMAMFASLASQLEVSTAQVTVLCALMLIAHSLPIEVTVSKKTGVPFVPILLLRIVGAFIYGIILYRVFDFFQILQEPAVSCFKVVTKEQTVLQWSVDQCLNLFFMIVMIFLILLFIRILKITGIIGCLERVLGPFLCYFGMSKNAAPVTLVGMLLGLGYGGALIIRETGSGSLERREIVFAMVLMALCHGLLEDTILMMSLGASLLGILWGRIVFALLVTYLLVQCMKLFDKKERCQ